MAEPIQLVAGSEGAVQFGAILKILRHRSQLDAKDLAAQAQVSVSFVSMIELGNRAPSRKVAFDFLSCVKEQDCVRWSSDRLTLTLEHPITHEETSFIFTHEDKGRGKEKGVATVLTRDEHIRLECIKAASRLSMAPSALSVTDSTILRAKAFEAYIKTGES